MRPDFRPLAGPRALTTRETASGCVKDEIGKICSQTSRIYAALQSRSVKGPVSPFPHDQDPQPTSRSSKHCDAAIALALASAI